MSEPKSITIPFNFEPRWYQLEFLQSPKRFKVAVFHRRGGKSKTAFNEQVRKTQLPHLAGKSFYYILPTYSQAKKVIWDAFVKTHVPMEIVEKINGSELSIYYKNGSIQRIVGCDNYKNLKGINGIDFVLDEYQLIDKRVWTEVIKPIVSENGGSCSFIGTPEGRNQLWEILEFAKANPDTWFASVKTVDDTLGIPQEELERDKMMMPEALFQQEYFCSFTEGAGAVFKRIKENTYEADDYVDSRHFYNLGVDLAKYQDFTVLTPFDLCTFQAKKQEKFNQVDWNFQKMLVEAKARKYNNAQLKIDRTGVGDPIVEDLERLGLNIGEDGAIVFSVNSKKELLSHLAILLEQNKIKIPNDPELITQLEAWQYKLSDVKNGTPKVIMVGRKEIHDDMVMSLALAVHGVDIPIRNFYDDGSDRDDDSLSGSAKPFDKFAII